MFGFYILFRIVGVFLVGVAALVVIVLLIPLIIVAFVYVLIRSLVEAHRESKPVPPREPKPVAATPDSLYKQQAAARAQDRAASHQ